MMSPGLSWSWIDEAMIMAVDLEGDHQRWLPLK
jgi:hypothetical protein